MQSGCTAHRKHLGHRIIRKFLKRTAEEEVRQGLPTLFPRLWRYALVLTSNPESAADLAQSTCLRALERSAQYTPGTNLDRWLFRMAHRIWLNELRSNAVRRGGGLLAVEDVPIPDGKHDAEMNFFVREVLHNIYQLPEAQRVCVFLVYVEGYKYAEAADILSIPVGTVMSRLSAARKSVVEGMSEKDKKLG
ncbi:RNA polymerase sigma factor [Sulfitobacter pontiacus]|uniref:RNA polymerase sigma factor n=1 Tax=Sulfitobacter pontiacus TaxID=60137 RepID=UPI0030EB4121